MPNFHRFYIPNSIVFLTLVTSGRAPYLQADYDIDLFWDTLRRVQTIHPFRLLAYVILPDHFHCLMRVEDKSSNFSIVVHSIKRNYTLNFKRAHGITSSFVLWQARFWDHIIRDEDDLNRHFDYIHWNPVKHGHAKEPSNWSHSSYAHWREKGFYDPAWGAAGEPLLIKGMSFE